jgi:hypothetical protein
VAKSFVKTFCRGINTGYSFFVIVAYGHFCVNTRFTLFGTPDFVIKTLELMKK